MIIHPTRTNLLLLRERAASVANSVGILKARRQALIREFLTVTIPYDRVYVGSGMLTGEVVRLEQDGAIIQVYEDTRGLGTGEPVKGTGVPLVIRLGPGLLSGMFDGLQRPLDRLEELTGAFITTGKEIYALDYMRKWRFHPIKKPGDRVEIGEKIGYVQERHIKHYILSHTGGKIASLRSEEFSLNEPLGEYEGGQEVVGCKECLFASRDRTEESLHPHSRSSQARGSLTSFFHSQREGRPSFPVGSVRARPYSSSLLQNLRTWT